MDPFETEETRARAEWYHVVGIPTVIIDGKYSVVGAASCNSAAIEYRAKYEQRIAETGGTSPVSITGGCMVSNSEISMRATFQLLDPVVLQDLRATLIVYEDGIHQNGYMFYDDEWNRIAHVIYDQPIVLSAPGDAAEVSTTVPLSPAWDPAGLHVVAYLQTTSGNREVIQASLIPQLCSVAFDPPVESVPSGNGSAYFEGTITNTDDAPETYTIELDAPFGDWPADFVFCGDDQVHTEPVEVLLDPGESCPLRLHVTTGAAREIRTGGLRVTGSAGSVQVLGRLFNGSPSIFVVDLDQEAPIGPTLDTDGYLYDRWNDSINAPPPRYMEGFDLLVWNAVFHEDLDWIPVLQAFMDGGGGLFLAGVHFAEYEGETPFARDYLGIGSYAPHLDYTRAIGVATDPIGAGLDLSLAFGEWWNYPDGIQPGPTAHTVLVSDSDPPWSATIRNTIPSGAKSVFMPFLFSSVSASDPDPNNRAAVMRRIIGWLSPGGESGADDLDARLRASGIVAVRPNPMHPAATIDMYISPAAARGPVTLEVFDPSGRRVATLFSGSLVAGNHSREWRGLGSKGARLESGVYFARLVTVEGARTQKLVLVR